MVALCSAINGAFLSVQTLAWRKTIFFEIGILLNDEINWTVTVLKWKKFTISKLDAPMVLHLISQRVIENSNYTNWT
jgi:hypothetical protein